MNVQVLGFLFTVIFAAPVFSALGELGRANLIAQNGAQISLEFRHNRGVTTPGSASFSFFADELRLSLRMPNLKPEIGLQVPSHAVAKLLALTKDGVLVDQIIELQVIQFEEAGLYLSGSFSYSILTKSVNSGQVKNYEQYLQVELYFSDQRRELLVNPVGEPTRFQIDLAAAIAQ